jgi:ferredoxin--NADP+ reductase
MDDVAAYERQLARTATLRTGTAASPQLGEIFRRVAERRSLRSRPDAASVAGAGPGAGPRVLSIDRVARDIRIIRVDRPPGLSFAAGQYVKFGIPGARSGSFSIASAPHEAHLEFCIELIPGGRLTPSLFALQPGDAVAVQPHVRGKLALATARCHFLVGTVTGIAPLRSMLVDALQRGVDAEFVVLHGASYADELPYFDELTELAARDARVQYRPTVSRPTEARNARWTGDTGRVDDLACRVAATLDPRHTHIYACGHPDMVRRVAGELGAAFSVSTEVFD